VIKKLTGAEVESIQGFIKPGTEATHEKKIFDFKHFYGLNRKVSAERGHKKYKKNPQSYWVSRKQF